MPAEKARRSTGQGASVGVVAGRDIPLVSLVTDFGSSDPFVGLVHARILAACPAARIVDLTHAIPPFAVGAAAFWLEHCWQYFPPGTVHLAVVDPGVGTARRILAVERAGHLFLAPDNGLLGGIAAAPEARARVVSDATLARLGLTGASATFHGRDVFAPLAGLLAGGGLRFTELGAACADWQGGAGEAARSGPGRAVGRVVWIDSFGNCFSNIDKQVVETSELAAKGRPRQVVFGGHELPLVRTYGERLPGTAVALVNSFGVLEAACVQGRACEVLELALGAEVELRWPVVSLGKGPGDS